MVVIWELGVGYVSSLKIAQVYVTHHTCPRPCPWPLPQPWLRSSTALTVSLIRRVLLKKTQRLRSEVRLARGKSAFVMDSFHVAKIFSCNYYIQGVRLPQSLI